jgi:hypothetical protein
MNEIGYLETTIDTIVTDNPYLVGVEGGTGPIGELGPRGPIGPAGPVGPVGVSSESLYAQDAFKDLLQHPPLIDIDFDDGIYATKRGPLPAFSRNTSGLFMNRDGVLVGKTTSSTSINLSTTTVGSTITVTIPSRAAVDWQLGSTVLLLSDTDADNQIDAGESYISCTLLDYTLSTNTLSLLINAVSGSSTISSWAVGYCGPRLDYSSVPKRSNNLLLNSENFTSVWSLQNTFSPFGTNPSTSSISNVGISPDNAFNATRITEVSDSAAGKTILRQYFPVETSRTYTFSVYAKYGDPPAKLTDPDRRLRYLALHSFLDTTVENAATFDLLNGVVGTSTRGTGLIGRTMTPVGDDWYRCSITFKTPSSTPWNFVDIRFHDTDVIGTDITTRNYRYMYIYGAQLEIGSTPTQYTKTTSYEINTVCGGALIEESRTNLLSRSEDFANSTWIKSNSSISGTLYTAPTGASTANELVEDSLNAAHTCVQNAATATIGTTYTFSVFVKRKPSSNQFLLIGATNLAAASFLSVNLTNGVTSTGIGSPGAPINVSSTAYPDGWYRVQFSVVATSAAATTLDIRLSRDGTWANRSYLGDGVQSSLIWGAQAEVGSSPTSYIPTTTATAIRASDDVAYTGTTLSDLWNKSEGTIVCEFDTAGKSEYNATYFNDSFIFQAATDQSNRIGVLADGVGNISPEILAAGVNQYVPTTKKYIENSVQRVAVSFKSGSPTRAYLTGSSYVTGTNLNATLPSITTLVLGKSEISSNYLNGHLRSFRYYGKYFSENTLKFLTTSYNGSLRDIDASRYIEKVNSILQVAQGTLNDVVTESQQDAINRFVAAGKVSGWWGRIKNLYLPIWGNGDANAVNLIDCSSGTFVGGVTHNAGWSTGDGTSGRFDYGTSPSAIGCSPTSGCIFFLLPNTTPLLSAMGTAAAVMGCTDVSLTNALTISKSSESLSYVYGGTTSTTFTYVAGMHLIKRESPSGVIYQTRRSNFEDLTLGPTSAGTGISSANMNAWARNVNGSFPANSYGAYNIGLHGMGLGLSNADGSKFITDCENLWESCTSYVL